MYYFSFFSIAVDGKDGKQIIKYGKNSLPSLPSANGTRPLTARELLLSSHYKNSFRCVLRNTNNRKIIFSLQSAPVEVNKSLHLIRFRKGDLETSL